MSGGSFSISGGHLLLNGKVIHLNGDSWHFMGVLEMTRRYTGAWFKMPKNANANAVRLHVEPSPSFFLDVSDEMGICVLDESGIWASDAGPKMNFDKFWNSCKIHLRHLVMRDPTIPPFSDDVCNETIPLAVNVFHAPDSIVQHLLDEINDWVALLKKLDPPRQWTSGDREMQFENKTDFAVTV